MAAAPTAAAPVRIDRRDMALATAQSAQVDYEGNKSPS
jgi:hypothetical protein